MRYMLHLTFFKAISKSHGAVLVPDHQGIWSLDNTRSIVLWHWACSWDMGLNRENVHFVMENTYIQTLQDIWFVFYWLYWLRLDIMSWITVPYLWCCWFQNVLKMTFCQSFLFNRLTQNLHPETWNCSIHLRSFVDSLGPRRFCGGPNGWSLKRVAWKQGQVWLSWAVGWCIEGCRDV